VKLLELISINSFVQSFFGEKILEEHEQNVLWSRFQPKFEWSDNRNFLLPLVAAVKRVVCFSMRPAQPFLVLLVSGGIS